MATGCHVSEIAANADTVMFCLSKGLGAPAGSMLVGTRQAMDKGRLYRKRLGGGMRQAGILAAAGLIALDEMPKRLHEDHANAKYLAEALGGLPGVAADESKVQTNIVMFEVEGAGKPAAAISAALKDRGVLMNPVTPTRIRAVTHMDVSRADCEAAVAAVRAVV